MTAASRCGLVALVGRPNVGKSTVANLIVGEKFAIVSQAPQTTRNRLQGVRTLPGGQIVVVDTPGIHRPQHRMNEMMVEEARAALRDVDLIIMVVEATGFGPGDRYVMAQLPRGGTPVLLAINKIDQVKKPVLLPLAARLNEMHPFEATLMISALTGENAADLPGMILARLPEGPNLFPEDYVTSQQSRFMAGELIREKILRHTRQEIPHETCVLVESWKEDEATRLISIDAMILVEKDSQKGIVIGKEGSLLKTVGTEAREDLERLLGEKVFLKLWVKVRPGWRDDPDLLRQLGLAGGGEPPRPWA
jgi:GTP-binding protein Era